jgi:WD40 repeat protein
MDNVKLILSDTNNKITIDINKNDLINISPYFKNLLTYGKEKNQSEIIIEVNDVSIAKNIITYNSADWKYVLNTLQCQNYFAMETNINKLYDLVVPTEGFNMLLKIIDELGCPLDDKLKETIKKNIPNDYDLNNLSDEFIKELISKKYYLVSNCTHSITIWNIINNEPIEITTILTNNIIHLSIPSNNQAIISVGSNFNIVDFSSWDILTGKLLNSNNNDTGYMDHMCILVFSRVDQIVASVKHQESIICLWNISSGKLLNTLECQSAIQRMALSPNGQTIAAGCVGHGVELWEVSNGKLLKTLNDHDVCCIAFSPDNFKIVTCSNIDYDIKIWDISSDNYLNTLFWHDKGVRYVLFSPNNQTIASICYFDQNIKLWDASSTGKLSHIIVSRDSMYHIAFSPDGEFIAAACYDYNKINLWNTSTGELSNTLDFYSFYK